MATSLLECVELESGDDPRASIIVLHGLGADGNDLVPIVDELQGQELAAVRFVFPHAPIRRVSMNGGYPMRAWYDIAHSDLGREVDLEGVRTSQAQVEGLIEREKARGVPASKIILAGFSQGGAIALYTGLRHRERLAGIVALSTYLIGGESLREEASEANRDIRIFMAHGTQDPIVRFEWGQRSRQVLEASGYAVEWHTYAMGHTVVREEIHSIQLFAVGALV